MKPDYEINLSLITDSTLNLEKKEMRAKEIAREFVQKKIGELRYELSRLERVCDYEMKIKNNKIVITGYDDKDEACLHLTNI